MKITKIVMENIKGQTAEQPLTGRDIIVGRNGAGKTTRMQTIGLAALGYVPGKGKTAADTFELASDNTMIVGIETDSFGFSREFVKKTTIDKLGRESAKISQAINISPSAGERTIKQKEERIRDEIGDFPAMLDFGAFIALSDTGKRDFIYNLSGNQFAWSRERVEKVLKDQVLSEELQQANPDMYQIMSDCFDATMSQYRESADVQTGLLGMMEYAKERLSYWKKEKQTAEAAAQKLAEIKNKATETDRDLADNELKLKKLELELQESVRTIATAEEKERNLNLKKEKLEKLKADIEILGEDHDQDTLEKLDQAAKDLEERKEKLHKEEADISQKVAEFEHSCHEYESRLEAAKEIENKEMIDLRSIQATIKAESELVETLVNAKGVCAFSNDIPCNQDFSDIINQKHLRIDALYEEQDEVQDRLILTRKSVEELARTLKEKRGARAEAAKTLETIRESLYRELPQIAEKEIQEKRQAIANRTPELERKRAEIAEIESELNETETIEVQPVKERKDALEGEIEALKETIQNQKKIQHDIVNIKANIIDSKTATYQQECWQQITHAIGQKGIQGEIVKEMLDPIRTLVDSKLKEMEIAKNFYFETESDTGREVFNFGWIDHETRRPFAALSQGEQLLLMIALMTTIIEKRDPALKILAIDNINDLDPNNLSKVIRGLNLAGKAMDNIILSGVASPAEEDIEGWSVWEL